MYGMQVENSDVLGRRRGRLDEAMRLAQQALTLREQTFGIDDTRTAQVRQFLAGIRPAQP